MSGTEDMWDGFFTDEADTEEVLEDGTEEQAEDEADEEGGNPSGGDPEDEDGGMTEEEGENGDEDDPEGGFDTEMQARIDAETQRRVDAAIKRQFAGVVNPFTGAAITTEAELSAYREAYAAQQQQEQLAEMGIDQEKLNEIVGNLPEVRQAKEMLARQQQAQANTFMQEQFDALKREYPDCGFADAKSMMADEGGRKALELWRDSPRLTIADAYMITHKEKIRKTQTAAVKQGVKNELNGKKHLTKTKGTSGGGEDIPADALEGLETFFPGKTRKEYIAMYRKNHKND